MFSRFLYPRVKLLSLQELKLPIILVLHEHRLVPWVHVALRFLQVVPGPRLCSPSADAVVSPGDLGACGADSLSLDPKLATIRYSQRTCYRHRSLLNIHEVKNRLGLDNAVVEFNEHAHSFQEELLLLDSDPNDLFLQF